MSPLVYAVIALVACLIIGFFVKYFLFRTPKVRRGKRSRRVTKKCDARKVETLQKTPKTVKQDDHWIREPEPTVTPVESEEQMTKRLNLVQERKKEVEEQKFKTTLVKSREERDPNNMLARIQKDFQTWKPALVDLESTYQSKLETTAGPHAVSTDIRLLRTALTEFKDRTKKLKNANAVETLNLLNEIDANLSRLDEIEKLLPKNVFEH